MSDESAAIVPVAEAFEALGVPYYVGGSVASSAHGVSRSTLDIALVAVDAHRHQELLYVLSSQLSRSRSTSRWRNSTWLSA